MGRLYIYNYIYISHIETNENTREATRVDQVDSQNQWKKFKLMTFDS